MSHPQLSAAYELHEGPDGAKVLKFLGQEPGGGPSVALVKGAGGGVVFVDIVVSSGTGFLPYALSIHEGLSVEQIPSSDLTEQTGLGEKPNTLYLGATSVSQPEPLRTAELGEKRLIGGPQVYRSQLIPATDSQVTVNYAVMRPWSGEVSQHYIVMVDTSNGDFASET